ncbi:MAG: histidine kinase N-terminal 7TM domain-containing protein [Halobacteriaceae archaeon]
MSAVLWSIRALDVAAMVAVGTMLALAWPRRRRPGGRFLAPMLVGIEGWILGDFLAQSPVGVGVLRAAVALQLVTTGVVVLALLLFVLTYSGRGDVARSRLAALLAVEPVGFALLVLTDPSHRLVFREPLSPDSVVASAGPVLVGHVVYSYALVALSLGVAGELLRRSDPVYRRQAATLFVGVAVPFLGNALYFFGPVSNDPTPLLFAVTGGLLTYAVVRADFLDLVPVARSAVLDAVADGVLVLDGTGAVLDGNRRARTVLGIERLPVGRSVGDLLRDRPGLAGRLREAAGRGDRAFELDVGDRVLDVRTTPLRAAPGRRLGTVVVLRDVTERERRRRELARERERLEEFAGVVSHDLRNPLNTAAGWLSLAREESEGRDEHLDRVADAHDRMAAIIEETLALVREGRPVDDPVPVRLAPLCERCWEMVPSGDATMEAADATILADPGRLRSLFENLFRNSVDHAGADEAVTVRVGRLADGFYVEDDGPGIPPERRAEVFEFGASTAAEGTGLGLAIVEAVAAAHGWDVAVTEAEGGGARFDVTGVAVVDE